MKRILICAMVILVAASSMALVLADYSAADTTYILYYDANGGSGAPPTDTYGPTSETQHTFHISMDTPTYSGYIFAGWSLTQYTPGTGDASYQPGGTIRNSSGINPRTLYAVWQTAHTYTLYFDANGGSGAPATQVYGPTADSEHVFTIPLDIPTNGSYIFAGWSTTQYTPGTGDASFQPGDTFRNSISLNPRTLYAVWQSTYTYTLYFDANGGNDAPSTMTYGPTSETQHTFTIPDTEPTYTGYAFAGWSLTQYTPGTGDASYQPGDTIRNSSGINPRTLYAVWSDTVYTLYFDANGGNDAPSTMTYGPTADTQYTFVIPDTEPTYEGYIFIGWSLTQYTPGTGDASYQPGDTIRNSSGINPRTLYAVWLVGHTYTLIYNANGGTGAPQMDVYGPTLDVQHTFTISADEPTYENYTFLGWSLTQNTPGRGQAYYQPGGTIRNSPSYDTRTLYAVWGTDRAYWSNGNPNGSISIAYHIDETTATNDLVTTAHLLRFDSSIPDDPNTQYNESFLDSGYYLRYEVFSERVGSSYAVNIIAQLYDSNNNIVSEGSYDLGSWNAFIVTIDTLNGTVRYTKLMEFRSFTNYKESVSGTVLSYATDENLMNMTVYELMMKPEADHVPRQSVVKTSVFLNTYGVVLTDPSLDISTYFPEMNEVRLNFYSFALYGDSMTVNGHTMIVSKPNITVYYTTNGNVNYIQDGPGDDILSRTLELTNVSIVWNGGECILTFENEDFSVDMGTYTDKEVSFGGIWYFATGLYEPYSSTETSYDVDWWGFDFDFSAFGLILAGVLVLMGAASRVIFGGHTIDFIIMGFGVVIALIFAGGLIIA